MKKIALAAPVLLAFGCTNPDADAALETAQLEKANSEVIQKFHEELVNAHNIDLVDTYFAEDYVNHSPMKGTEGNRDGIRKMLGMFFTAFPDINVKVENLVAEGDMVMVMVTTTGTMKGEMMGMPPTGKSMSITEFHAARMKDGKIVEEWGLVDHMGMMAQLGLMPGMCEHDPDKPCEHHANGKPEHPNGKPAPKVK